MEQSENQNQNQNQNQNPNPNPKRNFKYYKKRKYYNKNYSQNNSKSNEVQNEQNRKLSFKKVSVVVPLLNEEESLNPLYQEIVKSVKTLPIDYEIIFCDDGSTDGSLKLIRQLHNKDKKVRYISFKKNYGKSAALNAGFKAATGDAVITMDADLQDDPAEIPNLLAKLDEGFDLVSGWKRKRFDPIIKRYSSKFFNYITRIFSGIKIHDFNCGLKAYRAEVVKRVNVHGELHRYVPVLAKWEGFSVTEIPVKHHPRKFGKTKFGISRFFKGFVDLITVIFTTRYVKRPMHLFGFMGATCFLIGILVNVYLTIEWYNGIPLKNRPLLFLGILMIIVGAQFFAVGLLGELIVHHFHNDIEYNIKEKR